MKRKLSVLPLALAILLSACGQNQDLQQDQFQNTTDDTQQSAETFEYSFEGTTFRYGEHSYDLSSRVKAINGILSAVPVGEKIVVECHVGPKNGVYCIFDTASESFETDILGHHLMWHSDNITTAVYAFWSEVHTYDGSVLKTYDLTENEYISELTFSGDHTKLNVTIRGEDDTEKTDIIEL